MRCAPPPQSIPGAPPRRYRTTPLTRCRSPRKFYQSWENIFLVRLASRVHPKRVMEARAALSFAAVAALVAFACTSSETSVTAPTSSKCQVSVSGSPTSFGAAGGSGSLAISTPRDCTWSASVDAGWVSLSGDPSGQGDATVSYSVSANGQPAARTATVAVAGQNVQLRQDAAPCRYSLSRTTDTIGATGGSLSVGVTTLSGCNWSAASSASWIAIVSGHSGNATGAVGLTVTPNASSSARVGEVNVAGGIYTVNQDGTGTKPSPSPSPSPSPTPPPPTPPPSPGPGGQNVEFAGVVTNVSGRCPELTFTVSQWTVATDRSTKFKDISCGDVAKGGRSITGAGTTDAANVVHADIVKKAGGHD